MCFRGDYCGIIAAMLCYFLSVLSSFVTVSYCGTHVISTIHCCVVSVTGIHSYKILLCLWYLAYHSCLYVAIISIKMCLSINDKIKRGGEYKIT